MRRSLALLGAFALALVAASANAQSAAVGELLVASPSLDDFNFEKTVLLILHNGQDGSLAVALNRPTWVDAAKTFPETKSLANYSGTLFFGGPVAPAQLLVIFDGRGNVPESARPLMGNLLWSGDPAVLDELDLTSTNPPRVRVFAGYAEWGPGQLDQEISDGNWRVLPANSSQIFAPDPSTLWDRLPLGSSGLTASLQLGGTGLTASPRRAAPR